MGVAKINAMSILLGILPESIFFTLFIIYAKQLKKHKLTLFLMIFALNAALGFAFTYTIYYHLFFIIGAWCILFLLFNSHIIDVFLITSASLFLAVVGYLCFYGINNYLVAYIVNRLLLVLFFIILHKKLSFFYTVYKNSWNRTDGAKVKSITVRNISCLVFNLSLVMLYLAIAYYSIPK